jgi:hypothetical protein
MRNTETGCGQTQRTNTAAGINEMGYRRTPHMTNHRLDLRVSSSREFNVNKRLLFVNDQRARGEGENIRPYIAPGKKFVSAGNGLEVGTGNTRNIGTGPDHPPDFRHIAYQPFSSLPGDAGREKDKRVLRQEGRPIHGKTGVNKRRAGSNQGILEGEITLLYHDCIDVSEHLIDEPFPA